MGYDDEPRSRYVVDQEARYLVLCSVSADEIPMMPERKGYRDVDGSIGPDNHYNAMATNMAFLCIVIVYVCASHKSREWLGNHSVIQDYVSSLVNASDKGCHACSHLCA